MTGFAFRLEALLRIRDGLVRQEETRLAKLLAERSRLDSARSDFQYRRQRQCTSAQSEALVGSTGAEVRLADACGQALASAEREMRALLLALASKIAIQSTRYSVARRELQKLEQLRDAERALWEQSRQRREQMLSDELFLDRQRRIAGSANEL